MNSWFWFFFKYLNSNNWCDFLKLIRILCVFMMFKNVFVVVNQLVCFLVTEWFWNFRILLINEIDIVWVLTFYLFLFILEPYELSKKIFIFLVAIFFIIIFRHHMLHHHVLLVLVYFFGCFDSFHIFLYYWYRCTKKNGHPK